MMHDCFGLLSTAPSMQALRAAILAATCDADLEPHMTTYAVLFTDLSGWSADPVFYGSLQRILSAEEALRVSLASCGGSLLKSMGDSHLLLYPLVDQAIRCIDALRRTLPDNPFCAGIGYGPMLVCHHNNERLDAFGVEVSLASRLGEDVATGKQVLLSEAAYGQLGAALRPRCVPGQGRGIPYWELLAEGST